jgi:simple sugar transport system permease protein
MATSRAESGKRDERIVESGLMKRLLARPELGALSGAILVWIFFAIIAPVGFLSLRGTASYLEVSAQLGILAVAVALLMIGGEFDLSVGSMIGFAGVTMAILSTQYAIPMYYSALIALIVALMIGFLNGYLVIKTKLPSFIITLGSLFIIRGLAIALTRLITGRTQVGSLDRVPGYEPLATIFASDITIAGVDFPISIFWWLLMAGIATWVLLRTPVGNWIFGAGGDANAARNVGVPVDRLKIGLFMTTAFAAWLVAVIQISEVKSADVLRGTLREFEAIIAVVIGGTLLTGGYGSAIGAVLGALIFGMVKQGIVFARVDADWFQVFLGVMLISAVLVNNFIRKRVEAARS